MEKETFNGYIYGLILGDGYLDSGIHKRSFRIKSINLDFINSIENYLNKETNLKTKVIRYDSSLRGGVQRQAYKELTISSHPYFAKIYHEFYDDFKGRIITNHALDKLTIQGLANWYMSDGYVVKVGLTKGKIVDRRVELALDRYTEKDVEKIQTFLKDKLGFKTSMIKRKKGVYRLRMSLMDSQKFFLMIEPYIVDSFMFKLNLAYDYQPNWMSDEYFDLMNKLQNAKLLTNPYSG